MFLENPDERQRVTQNLRDEIISLRTKKNYSANYLATEVLKKPQSWLAQIETGRTKTISNSDLVKVFSVLLDTNADEYLNEHFGRLFFNYNNFDELMNELDGAKNDLDNIQSMSISEMAKELAIKEIKENIESIKNRMHEYIDSL